MQYEDSDNCDFLDFVKFLSIFNRRLVNMDLLELIGTYTFNSISIVCLRTVLNATYAHSNIKYMLANRITQPAAGTIFRNRIIPSMPKMGNH